MEIAHNGEEHGHAPEPASDKTDGHCTHYSDWDHLLGTMDFFGKMGSTVKTGKAPICVHKADYEGNTALFPTGIVDEGSKNEFSMLVGWGGCGDCYHCHEPGYEGCPESQHGNSGKGLSIAVEEETNNVDKLVGDKDHPPFYDTIVVGQRT